MATIEVTGGSNATGHLVITLFVNGMPISEMDPISALKLGHMIQSTSFELMDKAAEAALEAEKKKTQKLEVTKETPGILPYHKRKRNVRNAESVSTSSESD